MQIHSAILAGGKSSRYGGFNKAYILINGRRIIDRNISDLKGLFPVISIVTNTLNQFSDYSNYPMSSDYYKEIGPLAGIHSALKNTSANAVFISSCDMPFLNIDIINKILEIGKSNNYQVIVPRWNGQIEPLHALYHESVLPPLESYIKNNANRSVHKFLKTINCLFLDLDSNQITEKAFANINSETDLDSILG